MLGRRDYYVIRTESRVMDHGGSESDLVSRVFAGPSTSSCLSFILADGMA